MPVKFWGKTVTFKEWNTNEIQREMRFGIMTEQTKCLQVLRSYQIMMMMITVCSTLQSVAKDYFPVIYRTIKYGSEWFDKSDDPSVYKRGVEIERLSELLDT